MYFSKYFHETISDKTREQEEHQRIDHFKKYGYDCLIIWEEELKSPDKVVEKIKNF